MSRSRASIVNLHFCSFLWLKDDSKLSQAQSSCTDCCGRVVKRSVFGYFTSCTLRLQRNYSPRNRQQNHCFVGYAAKYSKSVTSYIAINASSSRVDGAHSGPAIRTVTSHRSSAKGYPYTKIQVSPQGTKRLASADENASQTFRHAPVASA